MAKEDRATIRKFVYIFHGKSLYFWPDCTFHLNLQTQDKREPELIPTTIKSMVHPTKVRKILELACHSNHHRIYYRISNFIALLDGKTSLQ